MWNSMSRNDERAVSGRAAVIALVALTMTCACAPLLPVGEGAMKLRGEIVSDGGEPCLVELRRTSTDAVAERFTAKGRFERTITLAPGTHGYYVAVSCPSAMLFTSRRYEIGGTTHFTTPLDLGTLYFPRRSGPK